METPYIDPETGIILGATIAFDENLFGYAIFDWKQQGSWFARAFKPGSPDLTETAFAKDSEDYKVVEAEVEENTRLLGVIEGRYFAIIPFTRKGLDDFDAECKAKGEPRAA